MRVVKNSWNIHPKHVSNKTLEKISYISMAANMTTNLCEKTKMPPK